MSIKVTYYLDHKESHMLLETSKHTSSLDMALKVRHLLVVPYDLHRDCVNKCALPRNNMSHNVVTIQQFA